MNSSGSAPTARDARSLEDPEGMARGIVLTKLAAQARTRQELDKALKAKRVPDEVAAAVLDRMEEVGLVDDAEFARDWVNSRQGRRHLSRAALRRELMGKGIDRDQIDQALEQVDSEDEYQAARVLALKKARAMSGVPAATVYRRLGGALARRGFGGDITSRVLAEVMEGMFSAGHQDDDEPSGDAL